MLYKFRVLLDSKEDIFRDIEILGSQNFEEFHKGIYEAFHFDGQEMASFFISNDDWEQNEEISQFDMGAPDAYVMNAEKIEDLSKKVGAKFIYVYDLLNYWTFLVELVSIQEINDTETYPLVRTSIGKMIKEAPEKQFSSTSIESSFDLEDEFDDLFDNNSGSFESLDGLDI